MERELSQLVATTAFRASADVGNFLSSLKGNCSPEEYEKFSMPLAECSADIYLKVLKPIFQMHPLIEKEFDEKVQKYGRVFWH